MNQEFPKTYALRHIDESVRIASQSGGAFTAISDWILDSSGIIYGCALNERFLAIHKKAADRDSRDSMRGSKYIQSTLNDTFKSVKLDLLSGKQVLFTGTSCQVAGLKKYLGEEYKKLLCVDIVCHGVPSPAVWKKYLDWQCAKNSAELTRVNFRNKSDFGWHSHYETLYFNNGRATSSKIFSTIFYNHAALRPCCYECPFKSTMHSGDITIADYWGIEKTEPELDDNKGVSLVLINSEKGIKAFEQIKGRVDWKKTKLEDSMQSPLVGPFPKPAHRDQFWMDFENKSFDYIAQKYGRDKLKSRIKIRLILLKNRITKLFSAR